MNHSSHQIDLPLDAQILNLAVNMGRVGNWVYNLPKLLKEHGEEVLKSRLELVERMNYQTEGYLTDLESQDISDKFKPTLKKFKSDFENLKKEKITLDNYLYWAERALTWADILQIRAKLA